MTSYTIQNESELEPLVDDLRTRLTPGLNIGIYGELGVGKTTLVRRLLRRIGYEGEVPSPTFQLCCSYMFAGYEIQHWDLYRVSEAPAELCEGEPPQAINLIEWPERGGERLRIDIKVIGSLSDDGLQRTFVIHDLRV